MQEPVETKETNRQGNGAWWVIGGVLCLSLVLAVVAAWQLRKSARFIEEALQEAGKQGVKKTPLGCAKYGVDWLHQCKALRTLCDGAVPQIVGACLGDQNASKTHETQGFAARVAACRKVKFHHLQAKFSFAQCRAYGKLKRRHKKSCARAYGTVWSYCKHIVTVAKRHAKEKQTPSKTVKKGAPKLEKASVGAPPHRTSKTPHRQAPKVRGNSKNTPTSRPVPTKQAASLPTPQPVPASR